ncbi:protein unc-13 homolog A [Caerostris extrusa]|uniref:Protein unc-13 homolog A n=1 Tax=Caerostris extrusa TaxID=172846 RepID=A0AAV4V639_CAEEX|nr:protein unc-13 homolog A [Caerostris extrusa]
MIGLLNWEAKKLCRICNPGVYWTTTIVVLWTKYVFALCSGEKSSFVWKPNQFNTYVTLKLQNVKSTTTSVKGNEPEWEVDFIFETNRMDIGLIIEVWNKGMLWDKLLGLQWMPLTRIKYTNEMGEGQWLSLDQDLVMQDGEVVGTKVPTGHSLLLEAHELPCDIEDLEEEELVKKLDYLNVILGSEISSLREQDRRHNFSLNCE